MNTLSHPGPFTSLLDALDFLRQVPNAIEVKEQDYRRALEFIEEDCDRLHVALQRAPNTVMFT